jgi:hypothetical protein
MPALALMQSSADLMISEATMASGDYADNWGNTPMDRLRRELVDAIKESDKKTEHQIAKIEIKLDTEIKEIKASKAEKWVEKAMLAVVSTVCMAVLVSLIALAGWGR